MKQKEKAPAAAGTVTSAKENKTQEQDNRSARNCKARILQETIEQIRRHECRNGCRWPGRGKPGAKAVTHCPNLCAVIAASDSFLWWFAETANVTPEIMAAVIEDGEDLTLEEGKRLADALGFSVEWLFDSELQLAHLEGGQIITFAAYVREIRAAFDRQRPASPPPRAARLAP